MWDDAVKSLFEWCVESLPKPWNWIAGFAVIAALIMALVWVFGGW